MRSAVIVDIVRTPSGRGKSSGALADIHPTDLLASVLVELVARTGVDQARIDDVIAGCVTQGAEQARNIARNAVLAAGLPHTVPGTTVDRQCGSSQQAVHFAAQGVIAGAYDIVVAAGVESMSRAPLYTATLGQDTRGPQVAARYPEGLVGQGIAAELIAARWDLSREDLDAYSARSHRLAAAADTEGLFDGERMPVQLPTGELLSRDETIRPSTTEDTLAALPPAFRDDEIARRFPEIGWRVTAGSSSPLTDGASAALIVEEGLAERLGLTPRARLVSFSVIGDDPMMMLTAPIPATRMVLERAGLTIDDIACFEVNEAFAPVPLAWAADLGADLERLNAWGGAIALGHALGSSGTRLFATALSRLEHEGGRYGLVTMCEGGGMANATIVERI